MRLSVCLIRCALRGNYEDERPYVEGDWCSRCPENLQNCENNLCGTTQSVRPTQGHYVDTYGSKVFTEGVLDFINQKILPTTRNITVCSVFRNSVFHKSGCGLI